MSFEPGWLVGLLSWGPNHGVSSCSWLGLGFLVRSLSPFYLGVTICMQWVGVLLSSTTIGIPSLGEPSEAIVISTTARGSGNDTFALSAWGCGLSSAGGEGGVKDDTRGVLGLDLAPGIVAVPTDFRDLRGRGADLGVTGTCIWALVESTSITSPSSLPESAFENNFDWRDRLGLGAGVDSSTTILLDEESDAADPSAEDSVSSLSASSISARRRLFAPLYVAPREDNGGLWHRRRSQEASLSSYGVESARNRARFMSVW